MSTQSIPLRTLLDQHTAPAAPELSRPAADGAIQCLACGHRCRVLPGRRGVCQVRFQRDGQLRVPFGYVAAVAVDPIEKKPFFHAYPGTNALSFGMLGCDFHCAYCQNWDTSQSLRDVQADALPRTIEPERLVELALRNECPVLTSTYNEPLITSEWALEIFRLGRERGLIGSYVSNGNGTPEVLAFIRPFVELYKVDLKGFRDQTYRQLGGVLENTLATIRQLKQLDFWVEIVTLIVPGLNDDDDEIREMADFLLSVSPDIPWHVTAFRPDYKMTATQRTPVETLLRAREIGRRAGLRYVYAGNLPGAVSDAENTSCPHCGATLIARRGFRVLTNALKNGCCGSCRTAIPGRWG